MAEQPIEFNLEVNVDGVSREAMGVLEIIKNDQTSTLREKMLASAMLSVCRTLNNLISRLETGSIMVRVPRGRIREVTSFDDEFDEYA